MHPEFQKFLSANGQTALVAVTLIALFAIVQWAKTRQLELHGGGGESFDQAELRELTAAIRVALAVPHQPRKGLVEQLAQFPLATQLAAVFATMVVSIVGISVGCATMGSAFFHPHPRMAVHSYVQAHELRTQQAIPPNVGGPPSAGLAPPAPNSAPVVPISSPAASLPRLETPPSAAQRNTASPSVPCTIMAESPRFDGEELRRKFDYEAGHHRSTHGPVQFRFPGESRWSL